MFLCGTSDLNVEYWLKISIIMKEFTKERAITVAKQGSHEPVSIDMFECCRSTTVRSCRDV